MNVLIIDDEERIREVIKEYIRLEEYQAFEASNGKEALDLIQEENQINFIILDIMMPKMDGFTFYKKMKEIKNIPTIILSARGEEYDKLTGFDLGVDDYMTKPFSPKELIARMKAVAKRYYDFSTTFTYQTLKIDTKAHVVSIDEYPIRLTPKEYELLVYFMKNKNIALSREQLLCQIWGYDFYGDDRTIDTHIKMLRNRLGKYRNLIVTVRGMGYKFEIH